MTIDGGLRQIFRKYVPEAHWQSIETGGTGKGIPDSNYCIAGKEGWIEFKDTDGWVIGLRPEQIGWIERRARSGGRVFVAVRRKDTQLWLLAPTIARINTLKDINPDHVLLMSEGHPAQWPWTKILKALIQTI